MVTIDFATHEGSILGERIRFETNRHGHYVMPFHLGTHVGTWSHLRQPPQPGSPNAVETSHIASSLLESGVRDDPLLSKEIRKLHVRLGHPSVPRLVQFLESSSVVVDDHLRKLVLDVVGKCHCRQFSRPGKPQQSSLPLATTFNDVLTFDIMTIEGVKILKLVDMFSRYMVCETLPNGTSDHVLQVLRHSWFRYFGYPKLVLTDKGSENVSATMLDFLETVGVRHVTPAAHSPESLGLCERLGGVVRSMITVMRRDHPNLPLQDVLDSATMAHNVMATVGGYSPCQLVCGTSPLLPSLLTDNPSANSKAINRTDSYTDRVMILHSARRAYSIAENDLRLRRVLLQKQTVDFQMDYQLGDQVIYFDHAPVGHASGWHGPVPVIGVNVEARELILLNGRSYLSRHMSRCRRFPTPAYPVSPEIPSPRSELPVRPSPAPVDSVDAAPLSGSQNEESRSGLGLLHVSDVPAAVESDSDGSDGSDSGGSVSTHDEDSEMDSDETAASPVQEGDWRHDPLHPDAFRTHPPPDVTLVRSDRLRKAPVRFRTETTDHCDSVSVVFVATKSTQERRKEVPPAEQGVLFDAAKQREVDKLREFDTFTEVSETNCPVGSVLDSRFVCTYKTIVSSADQGCIASGDAVEPRARLVVKGFQQSLSGDEIIDAPTASREGSRMIAFKAAQEGWDIISLDVQSAFLQSHTWDKDIYVRPPPDAPVPQGVVWKLKRSLYGLRSAPAAWWLTFSKTLKEHGFKQCANDQAIFVLPDCDGNVCGVMALHVDDLLATGNSFFESTLQEVRSVIRFGKEVRNSFVHTGIRFTRLQDGSIRIDQREFIEGLPPMDLLDTSLERPLTETEYSQFRRLLGSLMWCASTSRPDISVLVSRLSTAASNPSVVHYNKAEKVRRYLMTTSHEGVTYRRLTGPMKVLAFSDAGFQNLPDGGSQGGFLVSVAAESEVKDGGVRSVLLSWRSSKIRRVVRSTFAAETLQCTTTFDYAAWTRDLLFEMFPAREKMSLVMFTDCQSVVDRLRSLRNTCTEKRLEKEIWLLKAAIQSGEVSSWQYIPTEYMMADGMTKEAPKLRENIILCMRGFSYVERFGEKEKKLGK